MRSPSGVSFAASKRTLPPLPCILLLMAISFGSVGAFWQWFMVHEDDLLHWEKDRERIFDELHDELHKVHSSLAFEFGPPLPQREFIVSADGIRDAFPAVVALADAAPLLPNWQVIAFRPRRVCDGVIGMDGLTIDSKDIQFTLLDNGQTAGLRLFIPGYTNDNITFKMIAYLFLDEALGEFDVETRLGFIDMVAPEISIDENRHSFDKLPTRFDQLINRLEGRSGKPS